MAAYQPEDLVNMALRAIKYPKRLGSIYDGSEAAKTAVELYGQTRDELLRSQDWPFARRTLALALLKGPPPPGGYNLAQPWTTAYPPPGWLYEYAYPADCLEMRAIIGPPGAWPIRDPRPAVKAIFNDNSFNPAQKVVLCNVAGAMGVYRAQVVDISTWEPGFIASFVEALSRKFAVALAGNLQLQQATAQAEGATVAVADMHRG